MRPRLQPFGTDFGNGAADARSFQRDCEAPRYLAAKRPDRYRIASGTRAEDRAHRAVLAWMEARRTKEDPDAAATAATASSKIGDFDGRYAALSAVLQEDFVVQLVGPGPGDRAIAVYVSFPSGWRPERILGWSFQQIHAPVPDFADDAAPAGSLVSAMVERGPYVRFVWTICSDDVLDHHPDEGPPTRFGPETPAGWLRIERQVTVPFPAERASLFLIRTYLRSFASLAPRERADLAHALGCLPEATARYKGLAGSLEHAIALLA